MKAKKSPKESFEAKMAEARARQPRAVETAAHVMQCEPLPRPLWRRLNFNGPWPLHVLQPCHRCEVRGAREVEFGGQTFMLCRFCIDREYACRREARFERDRIEALKRDCGVMPCNAGFRTWGSLIGPPAYMEALADARHSLSEKCGPLVVWLGDVGTGKSQIASVAVWQSAIAGRPARIVQQTRLLNDLMARWGREQDANGRWLREWLGLELLVIDEITDFVGGNDARTLRDQLIRDRAGHGRKTILIGNLNEDQLATYIGDRAADRCRDGGGVIVFEGWPSFRGQSPALRVVAEREAG